MNIIAEKKQIWTVIGVYLIGYSLVVLLGAVWLRFHFKQSFSKDKLEEMLVSPSNWRDMTDNLCKYSIFGEPEVGVAKYVKIFLYCRDKKESLNTFTTNALVGDSFREIITEFARVMGFDKNLILTGSGRWKCKIDEIEIIDFETKVNNKMTIKCYEN